MSDVGLARGFCTAAGQIMFKRPTPHLTIQVLGSVPRPYVVLVVTSSSSLKGGGGFLLIFLGLVWSLARQGD